MKSVESSAAADLLCGCFLCLFLHFQVYGARRGIYAVSSNEQATRLSGIDTDKVGLWRFVLMGPHCCNRNDHRSLENEFHQLRIFR